MDLSKINLAIKNLLLQEPFYYYIFSYLDIKYTDNEKLENNCYTLQVETNPSLINYTLRINIDFFNSITNELQLKVLIHELLHIILEHIPIANKMSLDPFISQLAFDCEINQICDIKEPGSANLKSLGFDNNDAFKGSLYYYNILSKRMNNFKDIIKNGLKEYNDNNGSHEMWADKSKESNSLSNELCELIQKKYENIILDAANNSSYSNINGTVRNRIEAIKKQRSAVNWKETFRKFIAKIIGQDVKSTFFRINRRKGEGFPTIKLREVARPIISVDTSGSMTDEDLKECFSEINNIHKDSIDFFIIECDASFDEDDIYLYKGKIPEKRKGISGGGGTNIDPILEYVNKNNFKYSCIIHLTDGIIPKPKIVSKVPLLIILTSRGTEIENMKSLLKEQKYCIITKIKSNESRGNS